MRERDDGMWAGGRAGATLPRRVQTKHVCNFHGVCLFFLLETGTTTGYIIHINQISLSASTVWPVYPSKQAHEVYPCPEKMCRGMNGTEKCLTHETGGYHRARHRPSEAGLWPLSAAASRRSSWITTCNADGYHMKREQSIGAYRKSLRIDATFDHADARRERLLVELRIQQLRDIEEGYCRESSIKNTGWDILSSVCWAAVIRSESFDDMVANPELVQFV